MGNGGTLTGFTVTGAGRSGVRAFGAVVITQNVITGNQGDRGGGIYAYSASYYVGTSPLVLSLNDVRNNTASNAGIAED